MKSLKKKKIKKNSSIDGVLEQLNQKACSSNNVPINNAFVMKNF